VRNAELAKPIPRCLVYSRRHNNSGPFGFCSAECQFCGPGIFRDTTKPAAKRAACRSAERPLFCGAQWACGPRPPALLALIPSQPIGLKRAKPAPRQLPRRAKVAFARERYRGSRAITEAERRTLPLIRCAVGRLPGAAGRFEIGGYWLARASSASLTRVSRSSPGPLTRSGNSSRRAFAPAWRSIPSGSHPVQRQSAAWAPSNFVA
jgi:hypothetical protein